MSVYACLGSDATAIRDAFLTRLQSKTEDMRIKVMILDFLTVAVETQPGLIELFLNLEVKDGNEGSKVWKAGTTLFFLLLAVLHQYQRYLCLTHRSFCWGSGAVFMWCWTWSTPSSRGSTGAHHCSTEQRWPSSWPCGRIAGTVLSLSYEPSEHIFLKVLLQLGVVPKVLYCLLNIPTFCNTEIDSGKIWQHLFSEPWRLLQTPQRYF